MTNNPEPRSFLFLLASTRRGGNSERLARLAAAALPAGTKEEWLRLCETPLAPFRDIRHDGSGVYPAPQGYERTLVEATLAAGDLVFVSPLYWYSLPACAKEYLDHWSGWLRLPDLNFKERMRGKRVWVITAISGEDDKTANPLIDTLRLTANYLHMEWGGALVGHGNRPGDVEGDSRAVSAAAGFF